MTISGQDEGDRKGKLEDWIGARWQWLIAGLLLLFVLNNVLGVFAGLLGLIVFVNRIVGRVLGAARVVKKVQQIASDADDRGEEG